MTTNEYELVPHLIAWRGPNGSEILLDEDGIRLRAGNWLEEPDLNRLMQILKRAKDLRDAGGPAIPRPPSPDELDRWDRSARLKIAADAIIERFDPDSANRLGDVPF